MKEFTSDFFILRLDYEILWLSQMTTSQNASGFRRRVLPSEIFPVKYFPAMKPCDPRDFYITPNPFKKFLVL